MCEIHSDFSPLSLSSNKQCSQKNLFGSGKEILNLSSYNSLALSYFFIMPFGSVPTSPTVLNSSRCIGNDSTAWRSKRVATKQNVPSSKPFTTNWTDATVSSLPTTMPRITYEPTFYGLFPTWTKRRNKPFSHWSQNF